MNIEAITYLYETGKISKIDTHFANFIGDLSKDNNPEIFFSPPQSIPLSCHWESQ